MNRIQTRIERLERQAPGGERVKPDVVVVHGAPGGPLTLTRSQWLAYEAAHPGDDCITILECVD